MPDSIDEREGLDAVALDFAANTVCDGRGDNWASGDDRENASDDATAAITAYLSASGLLTALSSLGEVERQRDKSQEERNLAQNRIHVMKGELDRVKGRFNKLCAALNCDPDDDKAVTHTIADLKGLKRFKQRQRVGKLRSGEEFSADDQRHYEAKLAAKTEEVRKLQATIARLKNVAALDHPLSPKLPGPVRDTTGKFVVDPSSITIGVHPLNPGDAE